jgi:hypothetical protein
MKHSPVERSAVRLWLAVQTMRATSGEIKSTIMCLNIVMTLTRPLADVVSSTTLAGQFFHGLDREADGFNWRQLTALFVDT